MYKKAVPFFMICETPLHVGSGNDLGIVDLPIQREKHTGFPKIESSSLKGGVREAFESLIKLNDSGKEYSLSDAQLARFKQPFPSISDKWVVKNNDGKDEPRKDDKGRPLLKFHEAVSLAFGPDEGDLHAGALGFTDARLLLFPVKSMKGVFAWITCPRVITQFKVDLERSGIGKVSFEIPKPQTAPNICSLFIKDNKIVLEEYTFEIKKEDNSETSCTSFALWLSSHLFPGASDSLYAYWKDKMKNDIVVLSDDDFADFVTLSTEVITRTKINNETGTVQTGALFTEEYLPVESVLYSLALASPIFTDAQKKGIFKANGKREEELVINFFKSGLPEIIQIGANATIGKGIVRTRVMEMEGKNG